MKLKMFRYADIAEKNLWKWMAVIIVKIVVGKSIEKKRGSPSFFLLKIFKKKLKIIDLGIAKFILFLYLCINKMKQKYPLFIKDK